MTLPHPSLAGRFARAAALALIAVLLQPAQAQPRAVTAPEHAIHPAELQDNLDEVRRHYPKLYDRLRRAPRVDAARQARMAEPASQSAPVPIETRLKQTVRPSQPTHTRQPMPRGTP